MLNKCEYQWCKKQFQYVLDGNKLSACIRQRDLTSSHFRWGFATRIIYDAVVFHEISDCSSALFVMFVYKRGGVERKDAV